MRQIISCCKSCKVLFNWEERPDRRAPDCPRCGCSVDEPDAAKQALPKGPALLLDALDSGYGRRMTGAVGVLLLGAITFFGSIPLQLWPGLLVGLALAGLGGWLVLVVERREGKRTQEALAAADAANQASDTGPVPAPTGALPEHQPTGAVVPPPGAAKPASSGPGFRSVFVSVADIERIDREMGELYLHCPHCGEEERINDVGKLMLAQGNNVFAQYACKKCGTVFDGAQNLRKRSNAPS